MNMNSTAILMIGAWLLATSWDGRTGASIPAGENHNRQFKTATTTEFGLRTPSRTCRLGASDRLRSTNISPKCSIPESTPLIAMDCSWTIQTARHVSVSIDRPPQEVYDFVSDAENFLPKWATSSNAFV